MEPRDFSDPLDSLIAETLHDRLGGPPGSDLWERIARDIAPGPPQPTLAERLRALMRAIIAMPLAQSAVALAIMLVVVVQPAHYWMNQEYPVPPSTLPASVVSASKEQFLPKGDAEEARRGRPVHRPSPTWLSADRRGGLQP